MKKLVAATIAASLLVLPGQLLAKSEQEAPIVVERSMSPQQWAQGVSTELNKNLRVLSSLHGSDTVNGIIRIRFDVVNGEATNLNMLDRTGHPGIDNAARVAVRRLHEMPAITGAGRTQPVQANIIIASDAANMSRLSGELAQSERMRMASADPAERTMIALNMASRTGN